MIGKPTMTDEEIAEWERQCKAGTLFEGWEGYRGANHPNGAKTCCPQGHPYDEANTYVYRTGRYCRACTRARSTKKRGATQQEKSRLCGGWEWMRPYIGWGWRGDRG